MNEVELVQKPDGPMVYVPELGCEVGTFISEPGGKLPALNYHVPLHMRGDYRPNELANYDETKEYRVDPMGKVLCHAKKLYEDRLCTRRALNRTPYCIHHGGRLHPFDKYIEDNVGEKKKVSRYRQFVLKQITINDLDDEELAMCGFRGSDGRIFKPRTMSREMLQAFTRAIYERAQQEMRSNTVKAAKTIAELMVNPETDASIRLKAAEILIERNLGKTPQVVAITAQTPYEEIFDEITGGPRDASRAKRKAIEPGIIEADVIDESTDADADESITESAKSELAQHDSEFADQDSRIAGLQNARLWERNEAVLAQSMERPDFKYNLPPDVPLIRKKFRTKSGKIRYRHVDPSPNSDSVLGSG